MFVVSHKPRSIEAEAYRSLRTSIEYSSVDKELKSIVITSAEIGEGKSTVTGNLGIVLSQDEKKVIIIDGDLRKPSMHKKFSVTNDLGLSEILLNKVDLIKATNKISDNLDLITAGKLPPNPSEMIGSKAMNNLIVELKRNYDYILIDTPPIKGITDGRIISGKCDGTILVVRAKRTSSDSIIDAYKELTKVKANVLGTVLNGTMEKKNYCYY